MPDGTHRHGRRCRRVANSDRRISATSWSRATPPRAASTRASASAARSVTDMTSRTDLARNRRRAAERRDRRQRRADSAAIRPGAPSVARYNANGTLDTELQRRAASSYIAGAHVGRGLAVQGDGRLLLVGSMAVKNVPNDFTHFAVLRLNADGTFDNSFGTGRDSHDVDHRAHRRRARGRVAGGRQASWSPAKATSINPNFALARYNTDGTLDTSLRRRRQARGRFLRLRRSRRERRRTGRRQDRGGRPRAPEHGRLRPGTSESMTRGKCDAGRTRRVRVSAVPSPSVRCDGTARKGAPGRRGERTECG